MTEIRENERDVSDLDLSLSLSHLTLHLILAPLLHTSPSQAVNLLGEHFSTFLGTITVFMVMVQSLMCTVWQTSQSLTQESEHSRVQDPDTDGAMTRSPAITMI